MKRFSRCVSFCLALILLLAVPVFATEEATPYGSSYVTSYAAYLYKISDTQFQVWFEVVGHHRMDEIGASVIEVERSSDGSNWTTMQTYEMYDYPQMVCENTGMHADCVTYTYTSGYYYRAYVVIYAKYGNGIGEIEYYTPVKQY